MIIAYKDSLNYKSTYSAYIYVTGIQAEGFLSVSPTSMHNQTHIITA